MSTSNNSAQGPQAIHRVFSLVDRDVWIVTAQHGDRRGGLVATWVSQAALDPQRPTVLIGLGPTQNTCELVESAQAFGLHLLPAKSTNLALQFCLTSGRDGDKLAEVPHELGHTGAPLLEDCLARLECRVYARLATGDRTYFWADVVGAQFFGEESPLTEGQLIAAASPEERAALKRDRESHIEEQRAGSERWRANLPPLLKPSASDDAAN